MKKSEHWLIGFLNKFSWTTSENKNLDPAPEQTLELDNELDDSDFPTPYQKWEMLPENNGKSLLEYSTRHHIRQVIHSTSDYFEDLVFVNKHLKKLIDALHHPEKIKPLFGGNYRVTIKPSYEQRLAYIFNYLNLEKNQTMFIPDLRYALYDSMFFASGKAVVMEMVGLFLLMFEKLMEKLGKENDDAVRYLVKRLQFIYIDFREFYEVVNKDLSLFDEKCCLFTLPSEWLMELKVLYQTPESLQFVYGRSLKGNDNV